MELDKDQLINSALELLEGMSEEEAERFMAANLEGLADESGSEQNLESGSA